VTQLGTPLAKGHTADLYPWGEDQVVKLFVEGFSENRVHDEARITKVLQDTGLVPKVGEVVRVGQRLGIVYERMNGPSMAQTLRADLTNALPLARQLAELHAKVHTIKVEGLPSQPEQFEKRIQGVTLLSEEIRQELTARLEVLPRAAQVCHGDFHPDNILLTPKGGVVIDWLDASLGHPLGDVVRTLTILEGIKVSEPPLAPFMEPFIVTYLDHYFTFSPGSEGDLEAWQPIVAAARLAEGHDELQAWLIERVNVGLA
jgi:serine/threonine protein kinase